MARNKPAAAASSTASHADKSRKRGRPTVNQTPASNQSTRASKRLKESVETTPTNVKVTPKKSKYFEDPESETETSEPSSKEESESGYEDEQSASQDSEVPEEPSESDEDVSEEETKPKKRGRKQVASKATATSQEIGDNLWREGVKTGLGPGKQVFIAKPKAKGDGGVKYVPSKIHPNTMEFLVDLKKNNDREWLKRHDPDYRQSWKDWESFVETLTEKIAEVDETIPELPPKDLVFRIYRDVRFSSDPTPYKTHFSAAWSRTGRKGPYAAYYVQIQPGGRSFVGGGLWNPEAQPLALIRRSIDRRPERMREVLMETSIRKYLLGGIPKDEKKAVKGFCNQNAENALKTKPKGYDAEHPQIELLRLRNFTIGKRLVDSDILDANALETIMNLIRTLHPFVTYLNSIVMPDDDEDDDDEDEDDSSAGN